MHNTSNKNTPLEARLQNVNILLLDNSEKATGVLKDIFLELGFSNTFTAHNGQEGVQIMKEIRIDAIFTDWELKVHRSTGDAGQHIIAFSGLDMVERIRGSKYSPNPFVPVVMIAEKDDVKLMENARDIGVDEIIFKPIIAEDICNTLNNIIDFQRMFIAADTYRGPCRRRSANSNIKQDRRVREVKLVPCNEFYSGVR